MEYEELESYGYEGLVRAIENYYASKVFSFDNYTIKCIERYMKRNISKAKNVSNVFIIILYFEKVI